jgi:serine/threonine protein kinase
VTYVLLVGYPPFMDDDQLELFRRIRSGQWEFKEHDWLPVTNEAQDFIRGLLVTNPNERWSLQDCLHSSWLHQSERRLSSVSLEDSVRFMQLPNSRNRLRSVATAIMWLNDGRPNTKPTEEVATQAQEFASESTMMDVDDDEFFDSSSNPGLC